MQALSGEFFAFEALPPFPPPCGHFVYFCDSFAESSQCPQTCSHCALFQVAIPDHLLGRRTLSPDPATLIYPPPFSKKDRPRSYRMHILLWYVAPPPPCGWWGVIGSFYYLCDLCVTAVSGRFESGWVAGAAAPWCLIWPAENFFRVFPYFGLVFGRMGEWAVQPPMFENSGWVGPGQSAPYPPKGQLSEPIVPLCQGFSILTPAPPCATLPSASSQRGADVPVLRRPPPEAPPYPRFDTRRVYGV